MTHARYNVGFTRLPVSINLYLIPFNPTYKDLTVLAPEGQRLYHGVFGTQNNKVFRCVECLLSESGF